jgi:hypothetical protein
MIAIRAAKVALVADVALFASLVTFGEKRTSTGRQNPLTRSEMIWKPSAARQHLVLPEALLHPFALATSISSSFTSFRGRSTNQVAFAHGMF